MAVATAPPDAVVEAEAPAKGAGRGKGRGRGRGSGGRGLTNAAPPAAVATKGKVVGRRSG